MSWEEVGFVKASKIRRQILELLEKPMTPTEISQMLKMPAYKLPAVSRALRELEDKKVVVCLNPKQKKGRLYQRSSHGNSVLELLRKQS